MTEDALDRAVARTSTERTSRHARRARACFRGHATWFAIVNVGLVGIWAVDWATGGEDELWFLFPLVGWGLGLAAHYVLVRSAFGHRA